MRIVEALSDAIGAALHRDLPDITYQEKDWIKSREEGKEVFREITCRPNNYDIGVVMFPQTWGSTALGYGGIGGSAMTTAYTILVYMEGHVCVYFGGSRLAYKINQHELSTEGLNRFQKDVENHNVAAAYELSRYLK